MQHAGRDVVATILTAGLLLAACSDGSAEGELGFESLAEPAEETVATAAPSTAPPATATATDDASTTADVERALGTITAVSARAQSAILAGDTVPDATELPPAVQALLDQVYVAPQLTVTTATRLAQHRGEADVSNLRPADELGPIDYVLDGADALLAVEPCVVVRVRADASALLVAAPPDPPLAFLWLAPVEPSTDNPDAYAIAQEREAVTGDQRLDEELARSLTAAQLADQAPEVCT